MFCTQCGTQIDDQACYCSQCGTPTGKAPQRPSAGYHGSRRLSRPMNDKVIAGVCAGFARYLDVDVVLVRILWLSFGVFLGWGFVAYLIGWIVMPKDWTPAPACAPAQQQV